MNQLSFPASISAGLLLIVAACMEKERNDAATPASVPSTGQTQSAMQSPAPIQETAIATPNSIPQGQPNNAIGNAGGAAGDGGVALGSGGASGHGGTGGASGRGGAGGTGGQR
jgi:hypothetical protein